MEQQRASRSSRRQFLRTSLGAPLAVALGAPSAGWAQDRRLAATPSCPEPGDVTPPQTAGPFFRPNSPRRASLREPGLVGDPMVVAGTVLSTRCAPLAGALIDVWHADGAGRYDNAGYRGRGHLFADDQGRYRLETVVPGAYPGRTRHYHVRVQAPGRPVLTTQLYFPGEPGNRRDFLFDEALLMKVEETAEGRVGRFDFVLDLDRGR